MINPEAFRQWPEEMQEKIRSDIAELEKELQEILKKLPQWDRERREQLRGLNQEVVSQAVGQLIEELSKDYDDLPDVTDYIEQVRADLLENGEEFRGPEPTEPQQAARGGPREPSFRRYQVNVIVDNGRREGARPWSTRICPPTATSSAASSRWRSSAPSPPTSVSSSRARCMLPTAAI